ncbi:adenosine kinase [Rhodoligotrophos appendicifer]|uniref:adenosine kinase n=1 Tax=Rhodoligotrophos appendicifer TaxID=987056 RepID=UPI001180FC7E|nr:adenosine kinase [Rhodoligotrophos appendicifer]
MAHNKIDVLGIGNAIVDVLSRTDDAFLTKHSMVKGSMRLIDEETAHSLYEDMGPAVEISGGSAANTIAGVAALGSSAAFIGKVRNDQLGEVFGHDIRAVGVEFNSPPSAEGPATARCLILVTADGERTMNTFLGASTALTPEDIDDELVARSAITYLEGYLWDPEQAKQAFLKAARTARRSGNKVALSLSDAFCVDRHRDSFLELVNSDVDILFANESEITSLYQTRTFDEALGRAKASGKLIVLTRSEKGCVVVEGERATAVAAHPVGDVVDTTGAGDLFAAGFLFGLTKGRALENCAAIGALAAAEIISHIGARPEKNLIELARQNKLL